MINNIKTTDDITLIIHEKKKSGRKPKKTLQSETAIILSFVKDQVKEQVKEQVIEQIEISNNEEVIIKKRGRKANTKIINLEPVENNNVEIITNLIAYLPLNKQDISEFLIEKLDKKKEIIQSEQNINKHMDSFNDSLNDLSHIKHKYKCDICPKCIIYENLIKKLEEEIQNLKNGIMDCTINFNKKIFESKVNFVDGLTGEWNEKTNIACWWCCHIFEHIPLGIPDFINKNTYYLFGCFCSFNCAIAYNLDLNDYKIWDRQSNIYQMKNKIDPLNKITIQPAPPRQTLQMFGGPYSISDFRKSFFILNKEFRCFFPPMVSIIGIIEEDNRVINAGTKIKHNKMSDEPIIKRKTQLPKQKNTLQSIVIKTC